MSTPQAQPYASPTRPAFAPLQSTVSPSHTSSYSSTSSIASQSSTLSVPLNSPTANQPQRLLSSMGQQTQQQQSQQQQRQLQHQHQHQHQPHGPQRHPSFEYHPNREGAGQTAAETANYLSQMALLNEAAKRAQMAVVMRDLDSMEL